MPGLPSTGKQHTAAATWSPPGSARVWPGGGGVKKAERRGGTAHIGRLDRRSAMQRCCTAFLDSHGHVRAMALMMPPSPVWLSPGRRGPGKAASTKIRQVLSHWEEGRGVWGGGGDLIKTQTNANQTIANRWGGGGCHEGSVSAPVGTSECMHWFGFTGGPCGRCLSAEGEQRYFWRAGVCSHLARGGLKWSGCNVRIGLWPRLLPASFVAHCPHWSLPVHSGPGRGGDELVGTPTHFRTQTTLWVSESPRPPHKPMHSSRTALQHNPDWDSWHHPKAVALH